MKEIKLLLADDDADFRRSASEALGRRGFEVTAAEDGEEAVRLVREHTFDIAVFDLKMPKMGGIDALTEIRKHNNTLPVIILTGHGALDDAMAGITLGIVDFVNKPVDMDDLAGRIVSLLHVEGDLKERTVSDVMRSPSVFPHHTENDPVIDVISYFIDPDRGASTAKPRRIPIVLVFDRANRFKGIVEMQDVLRVLLPAALRDSPYASYLTGMLLGQCMLVDTLSIADLIDPRFDLSNIPMEAPLMEAVHCLIDTGRRALPVLKNGELTGIVTERCLIEEVGRIVLRGRSERDFSKA